MKKIYFITKNKYKLEAMRKRLESFKIGVENVAIDTPEIQADTCEEVAKFSAKYAAEKLNKPVLKADAGLFVEALGGLPGVYTNHFQKLLGPEKFLRLLEGEENRKAKIVYVLVYCEPGKEPVIFADGSNGVISTEPRSKEGMLIDFIFIPENSGGKSMGELREEDPELRQKFWGDAEGKFAKWFVEQ